MKTHDITRGKTAPPLKQPFSTPGGSCPGRLTGTGTDLHAKAECNPCNSLSGVPQSDNSEPFPCQFQQRGIPITEISLPAPYTCMNFFCIMPSPLGYVQNMGKNHLRHRFRAVCRNVGHHNSPVYVQPASLRHYNR
mgnify:CR=1 FL=1